MRSINLPGGFTVHGASPEQERILTARGEFVQKYAAEKGWDFNNLSMEQILEIRAQDGWKNPK